MKIIHCPNCGSGEINNYGGSDNYQSWWGYDCDECDWEYGRFKGPARNETNGTHPRDIKPNLVNVGKEVGIWCEECDVCEKKHHCGRKLGEAWPGLFQ